MQLTTNVMNLPRTVRINSGLWEISDHLDHRYTRIHNSPPPKH